MNDSLTQGRLSAAGAAVRVITYLAASLLLGAPAQMLGYFVYANWGVWPLLDPAAWRVPSPLTNAEALLAASVASAPVFVFITWCFRRWIDRASFRGVGFTGPRPARRFVLGWLVGLGLPAVPLILGVAGGAYRIGGLAESLGASVPFLLLSAIGFAIQGSGEELLVRGYLQTTLARFRSTGAGLWVWAVLLPSLLFAAGHAGNPKITPLALLNTALAGVTLAALVLQQRSLWAAMGAHAGWNFGMAAIWSLPVSGVSARHLLDVQAESPNGGLGWWFGGDYGPEAGLITTLLYASTLLLVLRASRGTR